MRGLSDLIGSRLALKVVTFFFNAVIVRFLSPEILSLHFRLQLPIKLIQILVLETFQRVFIRFKLGKKHFTNTLWLCIPFGSVLGLVICLFLLREESLRIQIFTYLTLLISLLSEPFIIYTSMTRGFFFLVILTQFLFIEMGNKLPIKFLIQK